MWYYRVLHRMPAGCCAHKAYTAKNSGLLLMKELSQCGLWRSAGLSFQFTANLTNLSHRKQYTTQRQITCLFGTISSYRPSTHNALINMACLQSRLHTSAAAATKLPMKEMNKEVPTSQSPEMTQQRAESVASSQEVDTAALPEVESVKGKSWRETYRMMAQTAKQYAIVAFFVNLANSHVWGIGFLIMVLLTGIDVVPILEYFEFSDTVISPFRKTGIGAVAIALGLFQISAPIRLPITLVGTHYAVRYIRRTGKPKWFYNKCFKDKKGSTAPKLSKLFKRK